MASNNIGLGSSFIGVAVACNQGSLSISANTPFEFNIVNYDTDNGWNVINNQYTVPESGYYLCSANVQASGTTFSANIWTNGVLTSQLVYVPVAVGLNSGAVALHFNTGDLVTLRPDGSVTEGSGATTMHLEISKIKS